MKLTQTVQKGGCAAKVSASELRQILKQIQFPPSHPQLMVDGGLFDDAAIYKINAEVALVQTLDFFTPIVDSPRLFGQIAAANSLSDVYAMGGLPKTAMAILAFPLATMPSEVIVEVLQGAADKIGQAKACFVGGHSIDDDTLKFGLSVTGTVHPDSVWTNQGAKAGDVLILTKAIGTGTITAGLKRGETTEEEIQEALLSMAQLNNAIDYLPKELSQHIHAATDITGFGLAGHSMQMAKASQVGLSIHLNKLPLFAKTIPSLEKGLLTKAHRTNREYTHEALNYSQLTPLQSQILTDPQTSGGLLLSVDAGAAKSILEKISAEFQNASIIGEVHAGNPGKILIHE